MVPQPKKPMGTVFSPQAERPATNWLVERARMLGLYVPEPVSRFTPIIEMAMEGRRYRRPAPVHHTPRINGTTGQPHAGSREAQRRLRQQVRRDASSEAE